MSPSPSPSSSLVTARELELTSLSLALSPSSFFSAPSSPAHSFVSASSSPANWSPLPSPSLSPLVPRPLFAAPQSPTFRLAQPSVARESLVFRRRQVYLSVYAPPTFEINGLPKVDTSSFPSTTSSVLAFRAQREAEDATFMPPILHSPVARMIFPFSPDYIPAFNQLPLLQSSASPLVSSTTAPVSQTISPALATSPTLPVNTSSSLPSPRPLLDPVTSPIPVQIRPTSINFGRLPTRSGYDSDASSISSAASSPFLFDISDASSPLPSPRRYRGSPYPSQHNFPSNSRTIRGIFIIGPDSDSESDEE
ncbi:hypothetical protein Sste5346_003897 [Sporothrix stenoceras]|uniref:Proteophosphoglycan ppg4 n=1 Tax=Sporothrix stenoceras TaxID=5173 RepID=A0ABR3ZAB5_9PEZI